MVRVSFRTLLTPDFRRRYQVYLQQQPEDDQQLEVLEDCFPNLDAEQYFRLFQILNTRQHPRDFQNIQQVQNQNEPQFQNQAGNQPEVNRIENLNRQQRNRMAQQPQPALVFVDDPFHGDINPGTTDGAKLYLKATASILEEDKFDLSISSAQKFLDLMRRDSANFGWGALIRAIPAENANDLKNLLKDHKLITEEHMKKQAFKTWGDHAATFATVVPEGYALQDLDPTNDLSKRNILYSKPVFVQKYIVQHAAPNKLYFTYRNQIGLPKYILQHAAPKQNIFYVPKSNWSTKNNITCMKS